MKLVWFRNDLRVVDNHALFNACKKANACAKVEASGVMAVAVITPQQWMLQDESKARVQFWLANLHSLKEELSSLNIPLKVIYTDTNEHIPHELLALAEQYAITDLYFNREYPEYEMIRDKQVESALLTKGINCHSFDKNIKKQIYQ